MSFLGRGQIVVFCLFAFYFVQTTIEGYPAKENAVQNAEPLALPMQATDNTQSKPDSPTEPSDKTRPHCYHFYLTRNMSSLLSDATKMLRQVHEKRERDWILTFIYRVKSLAEHLRSHPESKNYEECLSVEDGEDQKRRQSLLNESLRITQPELYFEDDMSPAQEQNQKQPAPEQEVAKESEEDEHKQEEDHDQETPEVPEQKEAENFNSVAESTSESVSLRKDTESHPTSDSPPTAAGADNPELTQSKDSKQEAPAPPRVVDEDPNYEIGKGEPIIHSVVEPGCEPDLRCIAEMKKRAREDRRRQEEMIDQLNYIQDPEEAARQHEMILKERIRIALLEEMYPEVKKLRTVGGTKDDLLFLWRHSGAEIALDEARKRREREFEYEENGAAAGDLNSNDKQPPNYRTVAPSDDQVYKKDDDSGDVLVQELYEARNEEPQYRGGPQSISDPHDTEYLIFSTSVPIY